MTVEEIHYYEDRCETCTRAWDDRIGKWMRGETIEPEMDSIFQDASGRLLPREGGDPPGDLGGDPRAIHRVIPGATGGDPRGVFPPHTPQRVTPRFGPRGPAGGNPGGREKTFQDHPPWIDFWPKKKISLGVFQQGIGTGLPKHGRATSVLPSRSSWRDFWKEPPTPSVLQRSARLGGCSVRQAALILLVFMASAWARPCLRPRSRPRARYSSQARTSK
jgi:hypothetical protein